MKRLLSTSVRSYAAVLLGAPGGGKGTVSKYIVRDFDFRVLSTGDLLRKEVDMGSEIGLEVKAVLARGDLVPDAVVLKIVTESAKETDGRLLFDGFPRTVDQAKGLDVPLNVAIELDVPFETIIDRLSKRWIHKPSGRVYSYDFNPPEVDGRDDVTGEALTQRDDDKPDTVRRRLETYQKHITPLVDFYKAKGLLRSFQGTESKEIYKQVYDFLKKDQGLEEAS